MSTEQTPKELFLKRFAERFGTADPGDEENYYNNANRLLDDYESYEAATHNLLGAIDGNEQLMDMLAEASARPDFDPVVWMVEKQGIDLQAVMSDPDYATLLSKAHNAHLEEEVRRHAIDEEMRANLPRSLQAINEKAQEMGVGEKQRDETVARLWQTGEDMVKVILPVDLFELIVKGSDFDRQLSEAYEQGRAEGLNTKIEEHLIKVRNRPSGVMPTQKPLDTETRQAKTKNPFVDSDWS